MKSRCGCGRRASSAWPTFTPATCASWGMRRMTCMPTMRMPLLVPLTAKDAASVRRVRPRDAPPAPAVGALADVRPGEGDGRTPPLHQGNEDPGLLRAPASPWERGTNEHTNGLIRQCFPKGTDFSQISRRAITYVQTLLNGRPRKVLHWRTPSDVFHNVPVALET